MIKTIGFFGDSFCADEKVKWSNVSDRSIDFWNVNKYTTYIELLSKHYNAEVVSLGHKSSSIYDLYFNQFKPLVDSGKVPDICIFVWTNSGRLFHRKVRELTHNVLDLNTVKDPIWKAAKDYYLYLQDTEKDELDYISFLQYFDLNILSKLNSKIVHLWSFGNTGVKPNKDTFHPTKEKYFYKWTNGVEIRPSMSSIALVNSSIKDVYDHYWPNHLRGDMKNRIVFEYIISAIDNYESGKLINFTDNVTDLWTEYNGLELQTQRNKLTLFLKKCISI